MVVEAITGFIARTQADEIILCGATFDADARIRSLELTLDAMSASVPA
jgi:hypothetical protein